MFKDASHCDVQFIKAYLNLTHRSFGTCHKVTFGLFMTFFFLTKKWGKDNNETRQTPHSGVRERLDDGLIGRRRCCYEAASEVAAGPVQIRAAQAARGSDAGRGAGGRQRHQVTVSFHRKWRTLQKRVESRRPEAWFSRKRICLVQGSLPLESETGQTEVASTFATTVAVKPSSVEAMGVGRPRSPSWTPLRDGGTGSPSRQTHEQSPDKSSQDKSDRHGHSEGHDKVLPKVFRPWTP